MCRLSLCTPQAFPRWGQRIKTEGVRPLSLCCPAFLLCSTARFGSIAYVRHACGRVVLCLGTVHLQHIRAQQHAVLKNGSAGLCAVSLQPLCLQSSALVGRVLPTYGSVCMALSCFLHCIPPQPRRSTRPKGCCCISCFLHVAPFQEPSYHKFVSPAAAAAVANDRPYLAVAERSGGGWVGVGVGMGGITTYWG